MKTLMSGAALAAILALAMPAWADAPGTYRPQGKAAHSMSQAKKAQTARGAQTRKMTHRNMHRTAARHDARHHHAARSTPRAQTGSPTDNVANELNRMEAQRLMTGGSTPPMGGPGMPPAGGPTMAPMGGPGMGPMGAPPPPRPVPGQ
jgi:hypothetical protein